MDKSLEAAKIYDKIAQKYSEMFDKDYSADSGEDKFLSFLSKNAEILDLGCGTGAVTKYYLDNGFRVVGVDLSKGMIEVARKKYPGIKFMVGDMRKLKLDKKFDAVSFSYSFFYIEKKDALKVLDNVKAMLKPGGIAFFILQEGEGEIYFDELDIPSMKAYANLYTEKEISDLLISNGFKVVYVGRRKPEKEEMQYNKLAVIARLA